jgi:hypothetical protein
MWIFENMAATQDRGEEVSPTIVRMTYTAYIYIYIFLFLCVYAPPIIDEWPPHLEYILEV